MFAARMTTWYCCTVGFFLTLGLGLVPVVVGDGEGQEANFCQSRSQGVCTVTTNASCSINNEPDCDACGMRGSPGAGPRQLFMDLEQDAHCNSPPYTLGARGVNLTIVLEMARSKLVWTMCRSSDTSPSLDVCHGTECSDNFQIKVCSADVPQLTQECFDDNPLHILRYGKLEDNKVALEVHLDSMMSCRRCLLQLSEVTGNNVRRTGCSPLSVVSIRMLQKELQSQDDKPWSVFENIADTAGTDHGEEMRQLSQELYDVTPRPSAVGLVNGNLSIESPTVSSVNGNLSIESPTVSSVSGNLSIESPTVSSVSGNLSIESPTVSSVSGNLSIESPTVSSVSGNLSIESPTVSSVSGNLSIESPTVSSVSGNLTSKPATVGSVSGDSTKDEAGTLRMDNGQQTRSPHTGRGRAEAGNIDTLAGLADEKQNGLESRNVSEKMAADPVGNRSSIIRTEESSTHKDKVNGTHKDKVNSTHKDKANSTHKNKVNGTHKDKVNGTHKDKVMASEATTSAGHSVDPEKAKISSAIALLLDAQSHRSRSRGDERKSVEGEVHQDLFSNLLREEKEEEEGQLKTGTHDFRVSGEITHGNQETLNRKDKASIMGIPENSSNSEILGLNPGERNGSETEKNNPVQGNTSKTPDQNTGNRKDNGSEIKGDILEANREFPETSRDISENGSASQALGFGTGKIDASERSEDTPENDRNPQTAIDHTNKSDLSETTTDSPRKGIDSQTYSDHTVKMEETEKSTGILESDGNQQTFTHPKNESDDLDSTNVPETYDSLQISRHTGESSDSGMSDTFLEKGNNSEGLKVKMTGKSEDSDSVGNVRGPTDDFWLDEGAGNSTEESFLTQNDTAKSSPTRGDTESRFLTQNDTDKSFLILNDAEKSSLTQNALEKNSLTQNAVEKNSLTQNDVEDGFASQNDTTKNFLAQNDTDKSFLAQNDTRRGECSLFFSSLFSLPSRKTVSVV
ncbi:uncharacterized protein LOC101863561 [Aplysia californica]|uniref:Uncharacterized protein LOC101863561 n=1 Tax=Aplysia californica TaxID=6500 RepID=A0ABM0KA19_APLCA|nr:uncharacterized protein LOC101863561 [Aplysia californica]